MVNKEVYRAMEVYGMSRRNTRNFRDFNELWDEKFEEELGYLYPNDVMEEFKDK